MVLIGTATRTTYKGEESVSVPLRGLWFLSDWIECLMFMLCLVSVPLRGLWFLSGTEWDEKDEAACVSVPLRGLWFLS